MNEFIAFIITGILLSLIPNIVEKMQWKINISKKISNILFYLLTLPSMVFIHIGLLKINLLLLILGIFTYTFLSIILD